MKLLVTGGAGFIGSHLLQLLAQRQDIETVVYDNLSAGRKEHVPSSLRLVVGDVRAESLADLFASEKFDAVIHLAAQTMVPYSIEHPNVDCDVNLKGIVNVLECCRRYDVKNIAFSSSAAVYGDNLHVPLQETEAPLPTSFYGLTKMAGEHYLRLYHDLFGINATILRFANVYGERQGTGGEGGVVSIFCKLLAQGKGVTVFGNGEQTRDFVYAGDIAQALLKAVQLDGCHVINVSTCKETSLNELLAAFRQAVGHDFPVAYGPAREGDIFRSVLANDRCQEYLGFVPAMDINEGVRRTYADYLDKIAK
ncbi:NAD-dependent epimerase/dehydratase family protein [Phascolarctobacterium sp.]|uniref:NAD-dependent epimerase/dehydratase family protein n=1 Tax=Phascolarctobacterium sp. TaxID=2049039 RepID=UPI003869573D